jgi:Zinc knuckle
MTQPNLALHSSQNPSSFAPTAKLHSKLSSFETWRERGKVVCYHCGDLGHLSSACRNPIICFMCGKVGHRS